MVTRIFQIVIVSAVLPAIAAAQLQVGLQAGGSFINTAAQSNYLSSDKYSYAFGCSIGGVCNLHLFDWISLQAEPRYIQKGSDFDNEPVTNDATETLKYLEFPILIKLEIISHSLRPFFVAGPEASMLLSARLKITEMGNGGIIMLDTKSTRRRFDLGLNFGGGIECMVTNTLSFSPSVRYSHGFLNLDNATGYYAYARGFQFYIDTLIRFD